MIAAGALDREQLATFCGQNIGAPQIFLDERVRGRFLDDLDAITQVTKMRETAGRLAYIRCLVGCRFAEEPRA